MPPATAALPELDSNAKNYPELDSKSAQQPEVYGGQPELDAKSPSNVAQHIKESVKPAFELGSDGLVEAPSRPGHAIANPVEMSAHSMAYANQTNISPLSELSEANPNLPYTTIPPDHPEYATELSTQHNETDLTRDARTRDTSSEAALLEERSRIQRKRERLLQLEQLDAERRERLRLIDELDKEEQAIDEKMRGRGG